MKWNPCLAVSRVICLLLVLSARVHGQGYGEPLTVQGLDHNTLQSAASRAAGGITIGLVNDVGLMFSNPASLQSVEGIRVSIGGLQQYTRTEQVQHYSPLKYYSNFSVLMEGLTGSIPDPDTSLPGANPGDTVQRPYDTIGPNWSRSTDKGLPIQAFLAVPFSLGENKLVAGVGAVEYADLTHYYQNNNVLSPSILSERPFPTPRPPTDSLPTLVQWSRFSCSRDGSIRGYGAALSGSITEEISLGVSSTILRGSTDDTEQHVARGRLTFYTNYFRLDSVYGRVTSTGTSEYRGQEFTFSGIYRGRYVSVGFSVKPPATIEREYTTRVNVDSGGSLSTLTLNSNDEMQIPWRGTIGLSIVPMENVTVGLEYELRPFESAVYRQADGTESRPWLTSSVLHVGAVCTPLPWLALRAGVRGQAEVFEPEGNPIVGEPVSYSIYSAGAGVSFAGVLVNVTYEYALMKYQDVWGSAISFNSDRRHTIVADIVYEIPGMR